MFELVVPTRKEMWFLAMCVTVWQSIMPPIKWAWPKRNTQQTERDQNNDDGSAECVWGEQSEAGNTAASIHLRAICTQPVGQPPTLSQHTAAQAGAQQSNQSLAEAKLKLQQGPGRVPDTSARGARATVASEKPNSVLRCACQR